MALTTRYRSRAATLQASYTWSHTIDNQSDPLVGDFFDLGFTRAAARPNADGVAAFSRQFDSRADRGNSDFDQRHNFVLYSHWAVPSMRRNHWLAKVFRDWRAAAVAAFRTGFPFSVFAPSTVALGAGQIINQRADIIRPERTEQNPPAAVPGGRLLLNAAVGDGFAQPASGVLGNSGRNSLRGPGLFNVDLSLSRSFALRWAGESGRVTFRADAFNALNHANLNDPAALLGARDFGVAMFGRRGRQSGFPALSPFDERPREIQLMLRLEF